MILEKYSIGIGDRFAQQGKAQLNALIQAKKQGIAVVPVWNKSHREHTIVKTSPQTVRQEADNAAAALNWPDAYYVDADHINLGNADLFVGSHDFFTIDVADYIGKPAPADAVNAFVGAFRSFVGDLSLPILGDTFLVSENVVIRIAEKYLLAIMEAGRVYRHIETAKGKDRFVTEVSLDETDTAQTPLELFFILAGLAAEGIPLQTIAPKFTGRFNKGVDYAGDLNRFEKEFKQDLAVVSLATDIFDLPANLKLSVHSGSDKFSIYPIINKAIRRFNAGLHLKTAGTTWLEEVIGLAEAGGEGLVIAKYIYQESFDRFDELCAPYAAVVDIRRNHLPIPSDVNAWTSAQFVHALRHDPSHPEYNNNLRQLIHVGYKIAAELGDHYLDALKKYEPVVAKNVTANILKRHLEILFA